jgi:hypothetical protein
MKCPIVTVLKRNGDIPMESPIDERYRLEMSSYYLEGLEQKTGSMHVFYCPFCQCNRTKGKYHQKKGGMFWVKEWSSWRFNCKKCDHSHNTMYKFLLAVNPSMAHNYQTERYIARRSGKGTDCPNPPIHKRYQSSSVSRCRKRVGINTSA